MYMVLCTYLIVGMYPVAVKVGTALENCYDRACYAVPQDEDNHPVAEEYEAPLMGRGDG